MLRRLTRTAILFLLLAGCLPSARLLAQESVLVPFSQMNSISDGWESLAFPRIDRHSRYELVTDEGTQVVRAKADGGASGLIARLDLQPTESMILRWRWRVSNVFERGDARKKSGDDYPARIYVAFEFQPDKAGFFERARRKAAEVLFDESLPGNAVNYIWANTLPEGSMVPNPYTDRTMMVAVNSGDDQAGQWVTVERDIVADYRQAFGEAPPPVVGIAIMSDSDNTGESAAAWYGDITLSTKGSALTMGGRHHPN